MSSVLANRLSAVLLFILLAVNLFAYTGPDFNGDGITDLSLIRDDAGMMSANIYLSTGSSFTEAQWAVQQGAFSGTQRWFHADFNGDGRSDMAKLWDDAGRMSCNVHISNGSAFSESSWALQSGQFQYSDKWFVADFNGDGMSDLARGHANGSKRMITVYVSNGTGFNSPQLWANRQGDFHAKRLWMTGDFNGDNLTDFLIIDRSVTIAYELHLSNGTSFDYEKWIGPLELYDSKMKFIAADFDGDGLTDIGRLWNDNWKVTIEVKRSDGSSFGAAAKWAWQSGEFVRSHYWCHGDFNGDGKVDIARLWEDNGQLSVESYESNGFNFSRRMLLTQGRVYNDQDRFMVGDFSGDGKSDIAVTWGDATNWYAEVIVSDSGNSTVIPFSSLALGDYYSAFNVEKTMWGDGFVRYAEITGAVPPEANIQAVLDAGNDVFLLKNTLYASNAPWTYRVPYQRIETQHALFISDFAIVRQQIDRGEQDIMIKAGDIDYLHLRNLICDGNRYLLGQNQWPGSGLQGAMVKMGAADGHWIRRVMFYNTRTWSTCQIHEAKDAKDHIVEHNFVLGAGVGPRGCGSDIGEKGDATGGTGVTGWGDGFSVAAANTKVRYNFIMDCTDVGTVIFGAPGSHMHDNTIFNYSRESLGGINMVDGIDKWDLGPDPYGQGTLYDYRNVVVENNEILAEGARIQIGYPISNQAWSKKSPKPFDFNGGAIRNNMMDGNAMGYGYVISHVRNMDFTGNVSNATHSGRGMGSNENNNNPDLATAFLYDSESLKDTVALQPGFTQTGPGIHHLLYMNGNPRNSDGYHYYDYTDIEAESIVIASFREMLGRVPTINELTTFKNNFLSNNQYIGDDLKRTLLSYGEFINRYGNVSSENLNIFRTARWRNRIEALDAETIMSSGDFSHPHQLHTDALNALDYVSLNSNHNADITAVDSIPASMNQGDVFSIAITVQNTGTQAWQNTAADMNKIGLGAVGDEGAFGITRYYIPDGVIVAPGQSYVFNLDVQAPRIGESRPGSQTAFKFDYRMVKNAVSWFGESLSDHLGGSQSVTVQRAATASPTNNSTSGTVTVPGAVVAGSTFNAAVSFTNTGNTVWTAYDNYRLCSEGPADNLNWGTRRIQMGDDVKVKPGETYTFNIALTAPHSAGTYAFQWGMIQEGVGRFGALSASNNVTVSGSSLAPWSAPPPEPDTRDLVDRTDEVGGIITSEFNDSPALEGPVQAFDNDSATKFLTFNNASWIQYQFPNDKEYTIVKYTITSANDAPERDPKFWMLWGSDDESSWTLLDARSHINFENRFEKKEFEAVNDSKFKYYRFEMTADSGTILQFAEIELFGESFEDGSGEPPLILPTGLLDRTNELGAIISSEHNDSPVGEGDAQAFDNDINSKYLTFNNSSWVQHQFSAGKKYTVSWYTLTSANDNEQRDPLSWTLSASNDGANWTTLDVRTNVNFPNRFQELVFEIPLNNVAYEYYRFDATNNSGTILQYSELELWGDENEDGSGTSPDPYVAWKTLHGVTDDASDDDGDGISNLMEFALSGDPNLEDREIIPTVSSSGSTVNFTFNRAESDLTYTVESSTDLQNWTAESIDPGTVGADVTVPVVNADKLFLRLKVEN